jgi:hypothetical protein
MRGRKQPSCGTHAAQLSGLPPGAQVDQGLGRPHRGAEYLEQARSVADETLPLDAEPVEDLGLVRRDVPALSGTQRSASPVDELQVIREVRTGLPRRCAPWCRRA